MAAPDSAAALQRLGDLVARHLAHDPIAAVAITEAAVMYAHYRAQEVMTEIGLEWQASIDRVFDTASAGGE